MQLRCRENKQISLPEFVSVGFSDQDGIDFRSGDKVHEKYEVIQCETELLDYISFTETNEELDTLTVNAELVRDPEKFIQLCEQISAG